MSDEILDFKKIEAALKEHGIDINDFLKENTEWFMLEDNQLSPGIYRLYNTKILNSTFEEVVRAKDQIRVNEDCYPIGSLFGIDIYEATHMRTNQKIYITASEIYK